MLTRSTFLRKDFISSSVERLVKDILCNKNNFFESGCHSLSIIKVNSVLFFSKMPASFYQWNICRGLAMKQIIFISMLKIKLLTSFPIHHWWCIIPWHQLCISEISIFFLFCLQSQTRVFLHVMLINDTAFSWTGDGVDALWEPCFGLSRLPLSFPPAVCNCLFSHNIQSNPICASIWPTDRQ